MSTGMGRPREHDESTREALLDTAEALLAKDGKSGVTVRAVATATGLSARAVYSTLGSKDGLIAGLVGRSFRYVAERVESIPESNDPIADLVAAGTEGFRLFAVDRPHLFRLNFEQPLELTRGQPPVWQEDARRARTSLHRWVQRVGDRHPGIDVDATVVQFHAICQGLASSEINGMMRAMGGRDTERQWREALTAYVHGLVAAST